MYRIDSPARVRLPSAAKKTLIKQKRLMQTEQLPNNDNAGLNASGPFRERPEKSTKSAATPR